MQFIRNTLLKIIIKRKHPHIKRQPYTETRPREVVRTIYRLQTEA